MISQAGYASYGTEPSGYEDLEEYLLVNCCGNDKFHHKNFWQRRKNGRKDYYLIYVNSGQLLCSINGISYRVKEGHMILIPPHQPHEIYYTDKVYHEVYWVHFTGYGVPPLLEKLQLLDNVYYVGKHPLIEDLFSQMIRDLQMRRTAYDDVCSGYLIQLISSFSRWVREGVSLNFESEVYRVMIYLHEHYNKSHTTEALASRCNLSPYYFIHKFKKICGQSPQKYLTCIRIEKAKKMLVESDVQISDIAYVIGYKNPLYFSKTFKRYTGKTPSEYRREMSD
ncbi:helix-turn-helix transcriptional regulator [Vallitalea pronyensis]|uniref:Helix-turn-helix transcriptional regulator n=1 Tax=Vallitalea pronyensis TaxID=1348613 RepID=A0A8J8SF41_9FIRM|nr:AraC family transcriptional regulator [Vallitalea pronyensis]QUI21220.1 helix-turn-helix transcriptional regulator [Vallitalea pronyensis]